MARTMSRAGQPAYLYIFTWADGGSRARLGACHGEELYLLADSFPADWLHLDGESTFGEILRTYWSNFASSGQPAGPGLPAWLPYDSELNQVQELGGRIQPAPAWTTLPALQKIMQPILDAIASE